MTLASKAGTALGHLAKGVFSSKGRRPRILAHTGGVPPISKMGLGSSGGIKRTMNLERLKSPHLRGQNISGKRSR